MRHVSNVMPHHHCPAQLLFVNVVLGGPGILLALAAQNVDVVGISCVFGNVVRASNLLQLYLLLYVDCHGYRHFLVKIPRHSTGLSFQL